MTIHTNNHTDYPETFRRAEVQALITRKIIRVSDTDGELIAIALPHWTTIKAFGKVYVKRSFTTIQLTTVGYQRVPIPWGSVFGPKQIEDKTTPPHRIRAQIWDHICAERELRDALRDCNQVDPIVGD